MLHHIQHFAPDIQLLVHLYIRHVCDYGVMCLLCEMAIQIPTRLGQTDSLNRSVCISPIADGVRPCTVVSAKYQSCLLASAPP